MSSPGAPRELPLPRPARLPAPPRRSAAVAPRPGVVQGAVPERADARRPALARALRAVAGLARGPRRVGAAQTAALAQRVEREASGLARASDRAFDDAVAGLHAALRREGLREPLVLRGFALVREAARRALGTPHYDVQLLAGWVMAHHGLAEMETGEGKTLAATLPAAVAAWAGIPVHVVTANDYLVERDAGALAPLYARLGLTTGAVLEREPDREARRAAYACDVTYATHKQLAFDYLRDRLHHATLRPLARELGLGGPGEAPVLRGLCFALVDEADSVLVDDARTPLVLSRSAAPPDAPTLHAVLALARSLDAGTHFRVDRRRARVELTPQGRARLGEHAPQLPAALAGRRRREEWVRGGLCALHLFEPGRHYLVRDGAVEILDLPTGRRAPDRAFEGVIQPLVEAKEGLAPTAQRETVARISYQRFFRRYLRLAGTTGTAREVARELWRTYGLRTWSVPTRRPSRRVDLGRRVLASDDVRWRVTLERIRELHAAGRPVLVGTESVGASEHLSGLLRQAGLPHQVLSARQDAEEARVVARAGEAGRITVATRMAGRGTDIRLGRGAAEVGGLAVISTELGEARRIDRQLFGRCGRQGAPGSHEQLVSLEDRLLEAHLPAGARRLRASSLLPETLRCRLTQLAQYAEERRGALVRRRLLASEETLEEMLAFSGRGT